MKGKYLSIKFDTVDDCCHVQRFLLQENVQFYSYILEDLKPLRVVLKTLSLNASTLVYKIKDALDNVEFFNVMVIHITYYVLILKQPEVDCIFQIIEVIEFRIASRFTEIKRDPFAIYNC